MMISTGAVIKVLNSICFHSLQSHTKQQYGLHKREDIQKCTLVVWLYNQFSEMNKPCSFFLAVMLRHRNIFFIVSSFKVTVSQTFLY